MTAAVAYDAVAIRDQVRELGLVAEVDHSPVWGSPFKHVFVFLSDADWNGPLIHISPQEELENGTGLFVGERTSIEDTESEADVVEDVSELMAWLAERADRC